MRKIFFFFLLITLTLNAQELLLTGDINQGSLVIGRAAEPALIMLDQDTLQFDKNGLFVFGFDRDETGEKILRVKLKSGKMILKKFKIPKREYNIQRINNMRKELVTAPNKEAERIKKERKIVRAARAKVGEIDTALYKSGFIRPVKGGRLTSVFGSQRILNGIPKNAHNGLDIAAPRGTPVYAMTDGKVLLAADNFYYAGNFILLDHGHGLNSVYLHLSKKDVKEGEFVKKGQKIGEIGTTGRSTGPHLHWGVQWFGKRVDPAGLLKMEYVAEK